MFAASTLAWKIPWKEEPGWAVVHGLAKSRTGLSDFTFTFHFHALEKEMATHSRLLAWRSPGTGEPDGLLSMGSHRVGHDWSDLAAVAAEMGTLVALFLYTYSSKDVVVIPARNPWETESEYIIFPWEERVPGSSTSTTWSEFLESFSDNLIHCFNILI